MMVCYEEGRLSRELVANLLKPNFSKLTFQMLLRCWLPGGLKDVAVCYARLFFCTVGFRDPHKEVCLMLLSKVDDKGSPLL